MSSLTQFVMEGNPRGKTTPEDLGVRATLLVEKHAAYIKKVAEVCTTRNVLPHSSGKSIWKLDISPCVVQSKDSLEAHLTEHFRLSGVYWGLTALYLMGQLNTVDSAAIIDWVRSVSYSNC